LAVISAGCHNNNQPSQTEVAPPAVVVARVVQQTVPIYGEFVAQVQPEASVDIVARVEGVLQQMNFKEGELVKEGQVIYRIDPAPYQAQVDQAKAALEQQEALHAKSQQDVARYTPLAARKAIPQQDLDSALSSNRVNQANVDGAKAALVQAELNLSYCTIRAPFDGLIGQTKAYPGALVSHGGATVLNTVVAINPVRVSFGVPESGYLSVRRRNLSARTASPEIRALEAHLILADNSVYPLPGRFKLADSSIDPKTGTLTVVFDFPNPDGLLRPNGFGRVRLVTGLAENALLIPQKSVIEQQGGTAVLVVGEDNKVAQRTVVLGPQFEASVIVRQGLKPGDRVIVEGQQKARPGQPVAPRENALTAEFGGK
jgi:membrane fusion protein (multidrug efflux system)